MFIANLPTPPAGAVSQRVRFFKDGEFSHMQTLGLSDTLTTVSPDLTATVDYGDETGEQVGEVIALTLVEVHEGPVTEPAPEPPAAPAEETQTESPHE